MEHSKESTPKKSLTFLPFNELTKAVEKEEDMIVKTLCLFLSMSPDTVKDLLEKYKDSIDRQQK